MLPVGSVVGGVVGTLIVVMGSLPIVVVGTFVTIVVGSFVKKVIGSLVTGSLVMDEMFKSVVAVIVVKLEVDTGADVERIVGMVVFDGISLVAFSAGVDETTDEVLSLEELAPTCCVILKYVS